VIIGAAVGADGKPPLNGAMQLAAAGVHGGIFGIGTAHKSVVALEGWRVASSLMNLLRRTTGPARLDRLHANDAPSAGESGRAGGDAVGLIVRAMALAGLALALGAGVSMLVDSGLTVPSVPPAVAAALR
jgi:hypothetical protein